MWGPKHSSALQGLLILLQALRIANAQAHQFGSVLYSVSAVAFFGTPHGTSDKALLQQACIRIVSAQGPHLSKQSLAKLEEDIEILLETCELFEDIKLPVDFLSVVELRETKIKHTKLRSSQVIVCI